MIRLALITQLQSDLADARAQVQKLIAERDEAIREAERLRHGHEIEGDFVCPDSVELTETKHQLDESRASDAESMEMFRRCREERDELRVERDHWREAHRQQREAKEVLEQQTAERIAAWLTSDDIVFSLFGETRRAALIIAASRIRACAWKDAP